MIYKLVAVISSVLILLGCSKTSFGGISQSSQGAGMTASQSGTATILAGTNTFYFQLSHMSYFIDSSTHSCTMQAPGQYGTSGYLSFKMTLDSFAIGSHSFGGHTESGSSAVTAVINGQNYDQGQGNGFTIEVTTA